MTYTKPEIGLLGEAAQVIQFIVGKPMSQPMDSSIPFTTNPAYDLDE